MHSCFSSLNIDWDFQVQFELISMIAYLYTHCCKICKTSKNVPQSSVIFGLSLAIFGRFQVIVRSVLKCSGDIHWSSEGFGCSSEMLGKCPFFFEIYEFMFRIPRITVGSYECLHPNFGYLRSNLHWCYMKRALLFSQSELSYVFKCII